MAEGMTEIQLAAFALFALVRVDDGGFDGDGIPDDPLNGVRFEGADAPGFGFHKGKQRAVGNRAMLDGFGKAAT